MAYLRHPSHHEDLLSKIEKTSHPFSENHPFFLLSEIPSAPHDNIPRIISIKNKTKAEKLLKRLDFLQFFDSIILQQFAYLQDLTLQKQKRPFSALF